MKRNPFRSEADAFRLFLIVGGAALFVVAVALVAGSRVAAGIGVALFALGLFHMWRWIRQAISSPQGTDPESPDRASRR